MTLSLPSFTRFWRWALSLLVLLLGDSLRAQTIRYVRTDGSNANPTTATTWATSTTNLQGAINASASGDQVWVAQGIYKPGGQASTNRSLSFAMKNGVALYGGFAGNETSLSQRALSSPSSTTLSGDIGTAGNSADNSYHVFNNPAGLSNSAILDGFLITGGNANGNAAPDDAGGGMLNNGNGANNNCSPLIRTCLFLGNSAANGGGALYNAGYTNGTSKPSLINCAFQGNAAGQGGALFNDGSAGGTSNPELTNCSFQANSAPSGGAMSSVGFQGSSRPVLTNCVVWGNGGASTFANGPGAFITTSYSLFESSVTGYNPGTSNLTTPTSPFVNATDTRLNGCSPALNSGDNAAFTTANGGMPTSPTVDLAGNARVFPSGGRIDMGAYEFQTAGGLSISAPGVNTTPVGVAFSQSFTATIGTGPYNFSLASGSLPPGLSLATTGVLSGTPTQTGSFTLTAKASDANGCSGVSVPYVLTVGPASPIRYVRAGAAGSGNSWADASGNLQAQIDFAGAQQVWVAQGTYKPTGTPAATTTGPDSRTISFGMKNGVTIIGGFPATDTPGLAERNPGRFPTTLSGDIGAVGNTADNSYHVINNPPGLTNSAVLDGFLITGGNANGPSDQPTDGKGFGGGMYNYASSPTLIDCIFQNNSASFEGGGLFNYGGSNSTLTNCSFQGNTALYGGGMANNGSSPTAIFCSFQNNTASSLGGGVYNYYGSPKLISGIFQTNSATEGGGMYTGNESNPTVVNGLFQRNSAQRGGGVANAYTNVTLTNCSFQGNTASIFGGGVYTFSCSSTLANCVLFGNGDDNTFYSVSGNVGASYCLMETTVTGYTGDNNLTTAVSPFVSATNGRLNGCSPAINAGNNAAYTTTNTSAGDPDGNARVFPSGGRIDMGAYEYQAPPGQRPTVAVPSVSTATAGISFSQPFTASGGISPYSYSLVSGSLAPGLSLAPSGVVSGTPTKSGSFTITALAADATGCSGVSTPYVLTVAPFLPRYVREGASGSGSSWADASGDLQGQISLASDQQVWVAQGTYKPGPAGNTNRSISFAMKNGVTILGGFPATGTPTLSERYPGRYVTTLSGDIGAVGNKADNSYQVINNPSSLSLTSSAVLDGFLITGGNANGTSRQINGGGMFNNYSSPTLANCSFVGNSAFFGGGLNNNYSNPTLINCSFQTNSASYDGGAIFNFQSTSTLTNCSFQGNTAAGLGGAIYNNNNNIILTNCVLWNNGGNNTFYNGSGGGVTSGASITTSYSLFDNTVTKYSTGAGNLTTNVSPFVSATDTRLNGCSPALNSGDNAAFTTAYTTANGGMPPSPTVDLAGNARVFPSGGRIDMGAYEFQTAGGLSLSAPGENTATVGVAFNQSFTASGGASPNSYSLISGNLPSSLSLATTGVLSGTPTQAGSFTITVLATDANGCSGVSAPYTLTVSKPAPTLPDLAPLLYVRPSLVYGPAPLTVVVDVEEINSIATSGSVRVRLTKDPMLTLSFDASLSSLDGRAVQNSVWRFSDADPDYYILTTAQPIAPGSQLSFGLSGRLVAGASTGVLTVSATVQADPLVEGRLNNNVDAEKVEYFQQ